VAVSYGDAMEADITNRIGEVPERFDPVSVRGEMTDAEHLARYAWAAQLVPGRRVLDAGCGLGYGTALLANAGASTVTGVDVAAAVVEVARGRVPAGVELVEGDVHELPFPDGSFDAVVCFEVIEHVEDSARVIGELARVLAPGGVLLVSSPNRDVYVPGNPHHVHEFTPEELRAALQERLAEVRLVRQHQWIASAVLGDEAHAADGLELLPGLRAHKAAGVPAGEETYTIALASDHPLPDVSPAAVFAGDAEVRKWVELYDTQQEVLTRQHQHFETLGDKQDELIELRRRLVDAERALSRIPALEQELDEARQTTGSMQGERDVQARRAEQAELILRGVMESPSWRITAPLRLLKRLLS
jgi:ubiquinone/menaquinone biosynthesis C-methylase UbiE